MSNTLLLLTIIIKVKYIIQYNSNIFSVIISSNQTDFFFGGLFFVCNFAIFGDILYYTVNSFMTRFRNSIRVFRIVET